MTTEDGTDAPRYLDGLPGVARRTHPPDLDPEPRAPADAIRLKREADEIMYVNRVLFSPALFDAYRAFTATLFEEYARANGNAPLRVAVTSRLGNRRQLDWWDDAMEADFSSGDVPSFDEVRAAHDALSERFRLDLYVTRRELSLPES